jgi:tetratricopeptide (TPR) repeat protein
LGGQGTKPQLEGLLDGWKQIAEHLGKTERTVQRWEKSKGLPVRRLQADSPEEQPRVFAYKAELDLWWKEHQTKLAEEAREEETPVVAAPSPVPRPKRGLYFSIRMGFYVLALVVVLAIGATSWPKIAELLWPHEKILGVAPVRNLTGAGDPVPQQLAEALTEEELTALSRLQNKRFRVIGLPPGQVSPSPHLDYLLAGSVRRAGNKVAITAQLIVDKDQSRVWGNTYERDLKDAQDMIPIEIEISDAIIEDALPLLPGGDQSARPVNHEAYEAYLWGRLLVSKRTTDSLFQAIKYFERSKELEPAYAPAYAGLADCYFLLGSIPYTAMPPGDAFPVSEANARKALELDGHLAEAHISLGYSALVYRRDFGEAEKQFRSAIELRPEYPQAHHFYAYYLTAVGRIGEAVKERQTARNLDPLSPIFNAALGEAYYQARRFDLAIAESQKSLVADPGYPVALMSIARSHEQLQRYDDADAILQKALAAAPNEPAVLAMVGHEYAVSGRSADAHRILSRLQTLSQQRYVSPLYFALVYIGLGEKNAAFRSLDQAYAERSDYLVYLGSDPWADPLRDDPRFPAFMQKVGLPVQASSGARLH